MRISWLAPDVIAAARTALRAQASSWDDHFTPDFVVPPRPGEDVDGVRAAEREGWDQVTEHVARAERVSEVVREGGLEVAAERFRRSPHAVEMATLAAAAHAVDALEFDLVADLLARPIDALVFYAPFLRLLIELADGDRARSVAIYELFCDAYQATRTSTSDWIEKVAAVRDGLASLYIDAGRLDDGNALFEVRHQEDQNDVAVALSASRSFLAAGAVARAIHWLGIGAERADVLERPTMAAQLRSKQDSLRKRLS